MTEREIMIPHQVYGERAAKMLNELHHEGHWITKADRTFCNNIKTPDVLKNVTNLRIFNNDTLNNYTSKIDSLIWAVRSDAMKAEKELAKYKAKYGELKPEPKPKKAVKK